MRPPGSWLRRPAYRPAKPLSRIVAEASGNPLALLALPRLLSAADLAMWTSRPGSAADRLPAGIDVLRGDATTAVRHP